MRSQTLAMTRGMHVALDSTSDAVNPAYQASVVLCDAAEGAIVARQGSSAEEDQAAMGRVRRTCDGVFAAFEQIRARHQSARALVVAFEQTGADMDRDRVLDALGELQAAWRTLQSQWRISEPTLKESLSDGRVH